MLNIYMCYNYLIFINQISLVIIIIQLSSFNNEGDIQIQKIINTLQKILKFLHIFFEINFFIFN